VALTVQHVNKVGGGVGVVVVVGEACVVVMVGEEEGVGMEGRGGRSICLCAEQAAFVAVVLRQAEHLPIPSAPPPPPPNIHTHISCVRCRRCGSWPRRAWT
jgi:hypothetical protein